MASVVILGGGVAGLAAAHVLARAGHAVTVVERDGPTDARTGSEAYATWDRPGVPQFRQPHTVLARARNLLVERAPEVVDRLLDDGVGEVNFIKTFAPPDRWLPEDDRFTSFMTRRATFELALRRTAEDTPGVDILSGVRATGLVLEARGTTGLWAAGLETAAGELRADVVVDAGGRRSPVARWLAEAGVTVPEQVEDCGMTYHSRHFVLREDAPLSLPFLALLRAELRGVATITFPGEGRTFALCLAPASWDDELKVLRHTRAWDAAVAAMPALAPWADPANATPMDEVATMAGHRNVLRRYVVDEQPLVAGLLTVGDALCSTNPSNAWGISMALTTAFAAVDAVGSHHADPASMVLAYHDAVSGGVEDVFVESASIDRLRRYRWRDEEVPEAEAAEAERQLLLRTLAIGAPRSLELARPLLRRVNLLDSPRRTLDDADLRARLEDLRSRSRDSGSAEEPTREDLLAAIAAAA
jgi:2-polyprenyl-6-methoxyphenol hydroxylase-like FAD-dependent oxidoreductase